MFTHAVKLPLVGILAGLLPAQVSMPSSMPAPGSVVRAAHGLQTAGGVLTGGGPDYKVRFDRGGAEFTPALGQGAPRNYPLRYTLTEIRRGGVRIVAGDASVPVQAAGRTATYVRGAGVSERFEVRADGVELSYLFATRLGGEGDLVVRGRLDTELTSVTGAAGELHWQAGVHGGVKMGRVTGLDARGACIEGQLRLDGRDVELVLPDAFVDRAEYPLVLDPLIGTTFGVGSNDDIDADVAYDALNARYLVVWQRRFSGSNVEIRGNFVNTSGALVGSLLDITSTSDVAMRPTVASVKQTNRFLVAWQQGSSVLGPWNIQAATVDPAGGTISPSVLVTSGASNEIEPDAGGNATNTGNEALVVYEQPGTGVFAVQLRCPSLGLPVVGTPVQISSGAKPAISKSGGSSGRYLIVWQALVQARLEIRAAAVDRQVTILDPLAIVSTGFHAQEPDVDGDGTDFVVVYQRAEAASNPPPAESDIYCRLLRFDATTAKLIRPGAETAVEAKPQDDERLPAVGWLGVKYAIAWADAVNAFDYDLGYREIDANCAACSSQVVIRGSNDYDTGPELGTQAAAGDPGDQGMIAFSSIGTLPPFDSDIQCQLVEALGAGGAWTSLGGGCGGGGSAGRNGPFAVGNPTFQFTLSGAHTGASAASLNINAAVAPIGCGTCQILPPLVMVGVPIIGGATVLQIPIPCDLTLVGGTIQVQWLVVAPPSPCTLAPGVSFSDRVDATVGT